jgi:hypothetical protein
VTIEALARLLGLRRAGRPQAGQRLEAEVVEDLDLPAQLDELGERALDRRRGLLRQVKERRRRSIRRYRFPGQAATILSWPAPLCQGGVRQILLLDY